MPTLDRRREFALPTPVKKKHFINLQKWNENLALKNEGAEEVHGLKHWADELIASSDDPEINKIKETLEKTFASLKIIKGWNDQERTKELSAQGLQADLKIIIRDLVVYGKVLRPLLEELGRQGNPKAELERLIQAAQELIDAIGGLHVKALSLSAIAENELFGSVTQSSEQIAILKRIISFSTRALEKSPTARGRPKKKIEQMIAYDLSRYYVVLTGKQPDESELKGSLHDLISGVYRSLGIKADVMAQMRLALSRTAEKYSDYAEQ